MSAESQDAGKTTSNVHLREGPGTGFPIITTLKAGTSLTVQGEEGPWLRVSLDGQQGFVHRAFVLRDAQHGMSGFLIHDPDAPSWALAPPQRLAATGAGGSSARMAARIWNAFGGLLSMLAARLGIDPGVALAVVATESGGSGFRAGRMIIRFENHYFWRLWGQSHARQFDAHFRFNAARPWTGHQFRAGPSDPWASFHGNQDAEWRVFERAEALDGTAAKSSISMGLPQIMGANHDQIGYDSVEEMFDAFARDERTQLIGLFDFIQGPHTVSTRLSALQRKDFVAFAAKYNGSGQAAQYGAILQRYFDAFAALRPVS